MPGPRFSIVVVGDGAVGKSAMTLRFLRDQFHDEYDPTIEDSYCKHIEVDGKEYTLDIIDTAGQHEYRGHWNDQFLRAGDGFICVYSIASMSSFQELVGFRDQIWRAKESENVPIVVAANKSDLEDDRQVAPEIGQEFAELSNGLYIETSAKTGYNIHEMVHELVRKIVQTRQQGGYADHENDNATGDSSHDTRANHISPLVTMGYVKSPTPPAPMEMADGEEGATKERCCCTVM
ncbi:P-loop containing nucleoside triphosphate hydrolase protein [Dissophora ornata]|nr:P-loop containing nucleoside triphosphate hydrolase protein [Dissophora ornata]